MNVGQLRDLINNLPDEMEVVIQTDQEGNNFLKVEEISTDYFYAEEEDVMDSKWSHNEACESPEDWDKMVKSPRILLIQP